MAPKRKAGSAKGGRKKKVALFTASEHTGIFGVRMHDIIRTPIGCTVTVIGVKYDNPGAPVFYLLAGDFCIQRYPLSTRLGLGYARVLSTPCLP